MQLEEVIEKLESLSDSRTINGMRRFGINAERAYGISTAKLRAIARETGKDHSLAQQLWASAIHEARILASMIDDPQSVTKEQMEKWASSFDSWDLCDQCCINLFGKTTFAHERATAWSHRGEEFVKRAGFVLMAVLSVHDKRASNDEFEKFLTIIAEEAIDDRNFVKKAINWALRQIGKRNLLLNREAIITANAIIDMDSKCARWIASDALRELRSSGVQQRIKAKKY
jgi:3-methyladenine DNA glycosylase AlkD